MVTATHPETVNYLDTILKDRGVQRHLDSLKKHHQESYEHSYRVGLLSIDLGFANGLRQLEIVLLGYSGLLHDLGKRFISYDVLNKEGPLTDEEKKVMDGHPRLGFLELKETEHNDVTMILIGHHEFKTNGYPRNGKDRRTIGHIPREQKDRRRTDHRLRNLAEIVAAADMYDALSSPRAYKPSLPKEKVEEILRKQYLGNPAYIEQVLAR
ncbi:MAG: HD domain-containing phosphohydrolase [Nanoarchaeota archaeon]